MCAAVPALSPCRAAGRPGPRSSHRSHAGSVSCDRHSALTRARPRGHTGGNSLPVPCKATFRHPVSRWWSLMTCPCLVSTPTPHPALGLGHSSGFGNVHLGLVLCP